MLRIIGCWLLCVSALLAADPSQVIPLWPKGAPGEGNTTFAKTDTMVPSTREVAGRTFMQLSNVVNPTISLYPAPKNNNTGAAVLVFPGGSYRILAIDMEGTDICDWLNSLGVNAILLKYRVPARAGQPPFAAPLQDAQRAIGLVRSRAAEWGIDPKRIGVLGFSAGGHLAAAVSNNFDHRTYPVVDDADKVNCRPDFTILIYPAYLTARGEIGKLSPELQVTANTPPAFLVQAENDPVHVENSLFYFLALKNMKVPAEMHLFAAGGHGYGMRPTGLPVAAWPQFAERWLHTIGVLGETK